MSALSTRGTWAENVGLHFKVMVLKPSLHPVRDTPQTGGWTHSPFVNVFPQAGPGRCWPRMTSLSWRKGRDRQRDKESEETETEGRESEEGKDREAVRGGKEGEEAEETLLNAACEHRGTSTWKQAGLNHPQNMPL